MPHRSGGARTIRRPLAPTPPILLHRVPADRGICCHVGGQIDFDGRGNLFLSTGDDTNPFFSDGYAPLDDRQGTPRSTWPTTHRTPRWPIRCAGRPVTARGC